MVVVEKFGVFYQICGDLIWVEVSQCDVLCMILVGEGLFLNGGIGYEILDGMLGFGMILQMFDVVYWCVKEGELVWMILVVFNIKMVWVYLVVLMVCGYWCEVQLSVLVMLMINGLFISWVQVEVLKFLILLGVLGMLFDWVSVIDSECGVVVFSDDLGVEDWQVEMKCNVECIFEVYVGFGNVIVELNMDVVIELELVIEQCYDFEQCVLIL